MAADVLISLLTTRGYNVEWAKDGADALQHVNKAAPNLVLLDIMMPKMDGYQFMAALKSMPKGMGVKIMVVTARDSVGDADQAMSLGADDYLAKPYDVQRLLSKVIHLAGEPFSAPPPPGKSGQ